MDMHIRYESQCDWIGSGYKNFIMTQVLCTESSSFNSLVPERCGWNINLIIFKLPPRIYIYIYIYIYWAFSMEYALRGTPWYLTDDLSTLVQIMAWCCQATSHYLKQCWLSSRPQWVNSQRPSYIIWLHRSGSTLAHVMVYCLMTSS